MLRRDIRLRKEFLFRKSQEENDRRIHEKKQRIKKALDENKPIPSDIKAEAVNLAEALSYDENLEGMFVLIMVSL